MKMEFKDKLRALREERGLSRKKLAEAADISVRSVENYEQGVREPQYDVLERLADALEVDSIELAGSVPRFVTSMRRARLKGLAHSYPIDEASAHTVDKFLSCWPQKDSNRGDSLTGEDDEYHQDEEDDESVCFYVNTLIKALTNLLRPGDFEYLEPYGEWASSVETQPFWEDAVRADAARDAHEAIDKIRERLRKERLRKERDGRA